MLQKEQPLTLSVDYGVLKISFFTVLYKKHKACFIIGKTSTMEIHATQPKKDNGELAEMSTKYFSGNLL